MSLILLIFFFEVFPKSKAIKKAKIIQQFEMMTKLAALLCRHQNYPEFRQWIHINTERERDLHGYTECSSLEFICSRIIMVQFTNQGRRSDYIVSWFLYLSLLSGLNFTTAIEAFIYEEKREFPISYPIDCAWKLPTQN